MPQNPDGSVSISTIGDFIDEGMGITAYCGGCGRGQTLDLERLAEKLGRDHGALAGDLKPKLKCARCGSKDMSFIVRSNAGWNGSGGHSLSKG